MVTPEGPSQKESTYVIDAESGTEMASLINQERLLTRVMGGVITEQFDLTHVSHYLVIGCDS